MRQGRPGKLGRVWGECMYYTTRVPLLVSRQFEDEIILANLETGIYYSLRGTAADIWLGLKSGATVDDIVAAFVTVDGNGIEDKRQSVSSFVEELVSHKIVMRMAANQTERTQWAPQFGIPFSQPTVDRFDDLKELLLIDPVHDVADVGWPVRAKDDV